MKILQEHNFPFADKIRQNQQSWRELPRGVVSRPDELKKLSTRISAKVRSTFSDYVSVLTIQM